MIRWIILYFFLQS